MVNIEKIEQQTPIIKISLRTTAAREIYLMDLKGLFSLDDIVSGETQNLLNRRDFVTGTVTRGDLLKILEIV